MALQNARTRVYYFCSVHLIRFGSIQRNLLSPICKAGISPRIDLPPVQLGFVVT